MRRGRIVGVMRKESKSKNMGMAFVSDKRCSCDQRREETRRIREGKKYEDLRRLGHSCRDENQKVLWEVPRESSVRNDR